MFELPFDASMRKQCRSEWERKVWAGESLENIRDDLTLYKGSNGFILILEI